MQCPMINQNCILTLHCSYCSFNTLLLSNLLNHFKTIHSASNCFFSLYQCRHCQIISTSCSLLTEHSLLSHTDKVVSVHCIYQNHSGNPLLGGEPMLECLLCPFKAKEPKNMTLHYFAFHGVKNVTPNPNKHISYDYQLGFNHDGKQRTFIDLSQDESDLSSNSTGQSIGRRFSKKSIRSASDLGNTLMPYKCTHCGNAYNKRKYFAEHVFSCSKALQLTCPCGRVCKWRSNFYAHRKSCPVYRQLVTGGSHHSVFRRRGQLQSKSNSNDESESSINPQENLLDMSTTTTNTSNTPTSTTTTNKDGSNLNLLNTNAVTNLVNTNTNIQDNLDSNSTLFRSHSNTSSIQTDETNNNTNTTTANNNHIITTNSLCYLNPSNLSNTHSVLSTIPAYVSNGNLESNSDLDSLSTSCSISGANLVNSTSILHALSRQTSSNLSSLMDPHCPAVLMGNYHRPNDLHNTAAVAVAAVAACSTTNNNNSNNNNNTTRPNETNFVQCVSVKGEPLIMFPGM